MMAAFHSYHPSVVGLDRDPKQLVALNAAVKRLGKRSDLVAADVSRLPFRNSSFQTIYCMEVVNMLPDDEPAIGELARVLQGNGTCTLSVPYEGYPVIYDPLNRLLSIMSLTHRQLGIWSPGVKRLYKPSELFQKLRVLGLNPIACHFIGRWLIPILENYLALSFYYKVLAPRAGTRVTPKREQFNPQLFDAISRMLDQVIKLDKLLNRCGTHFIVTARKSKSQATNVAPSTA